MITLHVLYEATFIGGYVVILYHILHAIIIINNRALLYFILGFIKHSLGYFLEMHQYFCGYKLVTRDLVQVFRDSVIEGLIFAIISTIINNTSIITLFAIGAGLHLGAEIMGIHAWFRANRCKK